MDNSNILKEVGPTFVVSLAIIVAVSLGLRAIDRAGILPDFDGEEE